MKKSFYLILFVLHIGFSEKSFSQTSDTIQTVSGKIFVGTFLEWQNNEISFNIFDAGVVKMSYKKINTIKANSLKYHIETFGGKVFYDTLRSIQSGEFVFIENGKPVHVNFETVKKILPFKKEATKSGFFGIGYNYSRSNNLGLFNADGGLSFKSENWMLEGGANSNFINSKANGLERNREIGNLKADRIINAQWQFVSRYIYQRNKQLGLSYRHLAGVGLSYRIIRKANVNFSISSGLAGTAEGTFDDQQYGRFEIPFLLDLSISRLGRSNLSLTHWQILFVSTGSNRRIRHDSELRLNMPLVKKLSLTTYLFNNYDSAPVQKTGTNKLDFGINTGLKLAF